MFISQTLAGCLHISGGPAKLPDSLTGSLLHVVLPGVALLPADLTLFLEPEG